MHISLSHSRSVRVIRNDILGKGVKSLVFRCNYIALVPFLRYSALNNGVTLKSGLGVTEGH